MNLTFPIRLILLISTVLLVSCGQNSSVDEKKVEQIIGDGKDYQDIIRNPVSAQGIDDTVNIGRAVFSEKIFDFGEVKEGKIITHDFVFTNGGAKPLLLHDATSTCGCTIPEIDKTPISPGSESKIHVRFDTKGKEGYQEKPVTVLTNGYPSKYVVIVKGKVIK